MAITTLNLRALNRSDTATSGQVVTATSATAADFQDAAGGAWTLLATVTASADATISFVHGASGVDFSSYDEHCFRYINIHPATDAQSFGFNMSIDAGSNYNVAKATTSYHAYHTENDSGTPALAYHASTDLALGTGFQPLTDGIGNDNDQTGSGWLHLYGLNSSTFIKHFLGTSNIGESGDYIDAHYVAGYGNTTSDVDAIRFQMASGNIDAGKIKLYGIS
jgi:hypothetical protein